MSRGDMRLKVVRGKIAYNPPETAPGSGAGSIHKEGDIFDFPEGPDISRFGNRVEVCGGEKSPVEETPAEEAPQEEGDEPSLDFEGAVTAVMYSRSFKELCEFAEDEGIKDPKNLKSKQKVAEAIVNLRRG